MGWLILGIAVVPAVALILWYYFGWIFEGGAGLSDSDMDSE